MPLDCAVYRRRTKYGVRVQRTNGKLRRLVNSARDLTASPVPCAVDRYSMLHLPPPTTPTDMIPYNMIVVVVGY